jgi:hypothetical protein
VSWRTDWTQIDSVATDFIGNVSEPMSIRWEFRIPFIGVGAQERLGFVAVGASPAFPT